MSDFDAEMRAEHGRVSAVAQAASEILPLAKNRATVDGMEDQVGQRLAALRFEIAHIQCLPADNLDDCAELLAGLREEYRELAQVLREWEDRVGQMMNDKRTTIEGVGTLERHHDVRRTNWQHDDLLRVVLDSDRRPKDTDTGEVESDLDVLRSVYGLRGYNARTTELRARGVDPDEYAETEDRGWRVSIK